MQPPRNTTSFAARACQSSQDLPRLQQQRLLPLLCQILPKQQASDDWPKHVLICHDDLYSTCSSWRQVMSQRARLKGKRTGLHCRLGLAKWDHGGKVSLSLLMQHVHWHCKQDALILPIDLHNISGTSVTLSTIDCTRNRNNDAKGCLVVD